MDDTRWETPKILLEMFSGQDKKETKGWDGSSDTQTISLWMSLLDMNWWSSAALRAPQISQLKYLPLRCASVISPLKKNTNEGFVAIQLAFL